MRLAALLALAGYALLVAGSVVRSVTMEIVGGALVASSCVGLGVVAGRI